MPNNNMKSFKAFLDAGWKPSWHTHPPAKDALLEVVIIEPRPHPLLPRVLANVSHVLPHAALTILHSTQSATFEHNIVSAHHNRNIRCIPYFDEPSISIAEYNKVLMSAELWKLLEAKHILVMQTDAGLRHNNILRFLCYDYVGAPWRTDWSTDRSGLFVGNGGLSLRHRATMEAICTLMAQEAKAWNGPEDIFFARQLHGWRGAVVPTPKVASMFSFEGTLDHDDPMGFHQSYEQFGESHPHLFTRTCANLRNVDMTVSSAWVEARGIKVSSSDEDRLLVAWLKLGTNRSGLLMHRGTVLPVRIGMPHEVSASLVMLAEHGRVSLPLVAAEKDAATLALDKTYDSRQTFSEPYILRA